MTHRNAFIEGIEGDLTTRSGPGWQPERVWLMQVICLILIVLAIGLYMMALPLYYDQLLTVCTTAECAVDQLAEHEVRLLAAQGLSLQQYAGIVLGLNLVSTAVWWGAAFAVFLRKSDEFMAFLAAVALVTLGTGIGGTPDVLMGASPVVQVVIQGFGVVAFIAIILFLYTFPDGRFVPHWTRWLALAWMANTTVTMLAAPFAAESWYGALGVLGFVFFLIPAAGSIWAQIYRYRRVSTVEERRQTMWVCRGLAVGFGGFITVSVLQAAAPALRQDGSIPSLILEGVKAVLLFAIPISITAAVLRHRLWDVEPIVYRTLVYSTLTAIVIGLYVLLVGALGTLFRTNSNLLFSLIATGVVAVLFQPLRERVQRAVNRLMFGERDDPYAVLTRLGERLEGILIPDAVLPSIVEMVKGAFKLPYAAIELDTDNRQQATDRATEFPVWASAGVLDAHTGPLLRLPLSYQHETLGSLLLAPRSPEESFSPADLRLLEDLARQVGVAVYAVRLTAELQGARERLVTAREEERRRLRRDLHDGLGPALAAQTLKVGSARALLTRDPATAGQLLEQLERDIEVALTDLRRVVYNLRPPALDDLGLRGAIQAYAAALESHGLSILTNIPEFLPPLPAAAEVAMYRIVQEALTNVVRHAQARRCTVSLVVHEATLWLEIADDGRGFPAELQAGVGLHSMRERAEELGGTYTVNSEAGHGTTVRVRLPLSHPGPQRFGYAR